MNPTGFQPFNPRGELKIYRRHLPHWEQSGCTYFVTFHLADSLPKEKLDELEALKREWEIQCPAEARSRRDWDQYAKEVYQKVDTWLDAGHGSCLLGGPTICELVTDALHHFDSTMYQLFAYVVMPNHCHLAIRPLSDHALYTVLKNRKGYIAKQINRALGRRGPVWHEESYDRIIRDEPHLFRVLRYIENNPIRANLSPSRHRPHLADNCRDWYLSLK